MIADQVPIPPSSDEESSDESIHSGEPIAAYEEPAAELTITEVDEITKHLELVCFGEAHRYKRGFVEGGVWIFLGCMRCGGVAVSTRNEHNIAAVKKLNEVMKRYAAPAGLKYYTSMAINMNTTSQWQKDKNHGDSAIMIFGNFTQGGEFVMKNSEGIPQKIDLLNKMLVFNGKDEHMSEEYSGPDVPTWRCSVVFFCHPQYNSCKERAWLEELGFVFPPPEVSVQLHSASGASSPPLP